MKAIVHIFSLLIISISSCTQSNLGENIKNQDTASTKNKDSLVIQPGLIFQKSEIINPKFNPELLFGTWTFSHEDPACSFMIDKNTYKICDYDGDGKRFYKIMEDSFFLDNPDLIFKGKIVKVTRDSLLIHWQENNQPDLYLRWKDH